MRIRRPKKTQQVDPETLEYLHRAEAVSDRADELVKRERRIIRENHLAPRIHQALKEARP